MALTWTKLSPMVLGIWALTWAMTYRALAAAVLTMSTETPSLHMPLASGGAIYVRDPHRLLDEEQLNGGYFAPFTTADWALIRPYLEENERLFGILIEMLLTVDGQVCAPKSVYRKVAATQLKVLT